MAEKSSFFNSISSDRKYKAEDWAAYFATFVSDGVILKAGSTLAVTATAGSMGVTLDIGCAFISGYRYENSSALPLTVGTANATLNRIDRVMIRWSKVSRTITACVVAGTAAATPTAPALTRTADVYDLCIAQIYVSAGATSITQSAITDMRLNNSLCGVATMIGNLSTTTLYNQIQAALAEFKAEEENDFSTWSATQRAAMKSWLNSLENLLGENAEATMAEAILALQTDMSAKGVAVYTHSYNSATKIHTFTGGSPNGRAMITADFHNGDAFKVNADTVTAYSGEYETDNLPNGKWVTFIYDSQNHTINFKTGGAGLSCQIVTAPNSAALPSVTKDSIGIITTTAVGNLTFGNIVPTSPGAGDVAITCGKMYGRNICIARRPQTYVQVSAARQYINGIYVPVPMYYRGKLDASWSQVWDYVIQGSRYDASSILTYKGAKGVTNADGDNGWYLGYLNGSGQISSVYKLVDLTRYTKLVARLTSVDIDNGNWGIKLMVTASNIVLQYSAKKTLEVRINSTKLYTGTQEVTLEIDVTSLLGNYNVGVSAAIAACHVSELYMI